MLAKKYLGANTKTTPQQKENMFLLQATNTLNLVNEFWAPLHFDRIFGLVEQQLED